NRWNAGYSKVECDDVQGVYMDKCPGSNGSKNGCFITTILTRSLGQAILDMGKSYQTQIDFRDNVLASSPLGKRMIKLYYEHNPAILSVVMRDYTLLAESINTWMATQNFINAVLATEAGRHADIPAAHRRIKFNKGLHGRVVKLIDRLQADSD